MVRKYDCFDLKTIGASHIAGNLPCQDSCLSMSRDGYKLICVCDGHGGDDYFRSDRGSAFATEIFASCVDEAGEDFLSGMGRCRSERDCYERLLQFFRYFLIKWQRRIDDDVMEDPFSEEEMVRVSGRRKERYLAGESICKAYGSTFIGAVLTDDFWFAIQIGDGDCICFDCEGKSFRPIPEDDNCVGNLTTSLCDDDACSEARFFFSRSIPASVFIASDGVGKSFRRENAMFDFYREVMSDFIASGRENAISTLSDYLPRMSERASKDDISIAAMMDVDLIGENMRLFERKTTRTLVVLRTGNIGASRADEDYCQRGRFAIDDDIRLIDLKSQYCDGLGKGMHEFFIERETAKSVVIRAGEEVFELEYGGSCKILSYISETPDSSQTDVMVLYAFRK